jgi:hypothetical protein
MFDYHPIHLMALFVNPRTKKMKQCTNTERNSCLEYVKQEMLIFDALDNNIQPNSKHDTSTRRTPVAVNQVLRIMENYYEEEDEQDDSPTTAAGIHQLEIDNYLKFGMDRSKESCSSNPSSTCDQEYNPLNFWKNHHSSYPRLARIAKRVFAMPTTSAAVER